MPQKEISYQDVLRSLHELSEAQKETNKQLQETNKQLQETEKQMKETDKLSQKTDIKLNKLSEMVGGITKNLGKSAEELFFNSFKKTMSLGNMNFHSIDRNLYRYANGIQDEFDIILTNDDFILIIETKHRFHPNDVKNVLKKIDNFKKLFPKYHDFKIFGAVAGLSMPQKTIELAKNYHFFVITQDGNDLKLLYNPDNKTDEIKE